MSNAAPDRTTICCCSFGNKLCTNLLYPERNVLA
jgi:hypothetical protein